MPACAMITQSDTHYEHEFVRPSSMMNQKPNFDEFLLQDHSLPPHKVEKTKTGKIATHSLIF